MWIRPPKGKRDNQREDREMNKRGREQSREYGSWKPSVSGKRETPTGGNVPDGTKNSTEDYPWSPHLERDSLRTLR